MPLLRATIQASYILYAHTREPEAGLVGTRERGGASLHGGATDHEGRGSRMTRKQRRGQGPLGWDGCDDSEYAKWSNRVNRHVEAAFR